MRAMNLPALPVKALSADECVGDYLSRLSGDEAPWPSVSLILTAYMAWPNDELTRNSLVATYLARFIETSSQKSPGDRAAENIPQSKEWAKFEKFGEYSSCSSVKRRKTIKGDFGMRPEGICHRPSRWTVSLSAFPESCRSQNS
jgi:hypothetical protein